MNLDLEGKTAIVTGSSRGIGFAIARSLLAEGCRVMINGRNEEALTEAAEALGGEVTACSGDVSKREDCDRLVAAAHRLDARLDIVVCNVGSGRSVPPGEETEDHWREMFAHNLTSTTNMVAAAETALSTSKGSVVCVSSICGLEVLGAPVPYAAAKAALNAYVRNAARPLARRGVRINAVAPGNVLFEGSVWDHKLRNEADAVNAMLDHEVALGRLGTPEEIADAVTYLASPRASFMTGSIMVVDGGQVRG